MKVYVLDTTGVKKLIQVQLGVLGSYNFLLDTCEASRRERCLHSEYIRSKESGVYVVYSIVYCFVELLKLNLVCMLNMFSESIRVSSSGCVCSECVFARYVFLNTI